MRPTGPNHQSNFISKIVVLTSSVILIILVNCDTVYGGHAFKHIGLSHRHKIQLVKKVGAALLIAVKNKRLMIPLPLPLPLPIPIIKTYQPVIHDPLMFKHQAIKHFIGKHLTG